MGTQYILRSYQGLFLFVFKLFDLFVLVTTATATHWYLGFGLPNTTESTAIILLATLIFWIASEKFPLYQPWRGKSQTYEIGLLALASALTVGSVALIAWTFSFFDAAQPMGGWFFLWFGVLVLSLSAERLVLRPCLKYLRRRGANQRSIVFVGMSKEANEFVKSLKNHPEIGFRFLGYVDDRSEGRENFDPIIKYLGTTEQLESICMNRGVDQIWFGYPIEASHRMAAATNVLKDFPIVMRQILNMQAAPQFCNSITGILGTPMLNIDMNFHDRYFGNLAKSVQDKIIAALVLILASPLFVAIALAVKLSSPGPILYRQTRVTWRNKPFEMLKFRSMPVGVEQESGPRWAQAGDNRATRVGAFLRATSLDELPQFWNVLKGDMSIVGPRPERPEFVEEFKEQIPYYMKKHRVKAGITGWAQINGYRGNTDLNKRIEYDLFYVKNGSFLFDLRIIFMTMFKGFVHKNAY